MESSIKADFAKVTNVSPQVERFEFEAKEKREAFASSIEIWVTWKLSLQRPNQLALKTG